MVEFEKLSPEMLEIRMLKFKMENLEMQIKFLEENWVFWVKYFKENFPAESDYMSKKNKLTLWKNNS